MSCPYQKGENPEQPITFLLLIIRSKNYNPSWSWSLVSLMKLVTQGVFRNLYFDLAEKDLANALKNVLYLNSDNW